MHAPPHSAKPVSQRTLHFSSHTALPLIGTSHASPQLRQLLASELRFVQFEPQSL
jgi:hypothetical protein